MVEKRKADESAVYQIKVEGTLDERWSDWFSGLAVVEAGESHPESTSESHPGPTNESHPESTSESHPEPTSESHPEPVEG